jgi:hypothetical protein
MSPDSGKHWCNPYSLYHGTTPGVCDSSNWQADGDAPKCDAPDSSHPCTNAAYLDATHSSIIWKAMSLGTENWEWINYGNQDGQPYPSGVPLPFDPSVNTCFMQFSGGGRVACVPNGSIMDVSAWKYYTCPAITQTYRCAPSDPANWISTLSNATPTGYNTYSGGPFNGNQTLTNPYGILYVKEFGSYVTFGQGTDVSWAPSPVGPWTTVFRNLYYTSLIGVGNFLAPAPALGYYIISTNPPHIRITTVSNNYDGGMGSPVMALWDITLGSQSRGESFQESNLYQFIVGSGYQFSDGHVAGSFPRKGLVWSFDFQDHGALTNWPFFVDRANNSVVISPCTGSINAPICGTINAGQGTHLNAYGIETSDPGYNGHFNTFKSAIDIVSGGASTSISAPSAMLGNGSYSVVGVYRYQGDSPYRKVGIWSGGNATALNVLHGTLLLDHGVYHYTTSFTFVPNNWYFVVATVQAQAGGCGASCVPTARVWVGGATAPGVIADVNSGVSGGSTATPTVGAGPFLIGTNTTGDGQDSPLMTYATVMVYDRPLTQAEVGFMYQSMKTKMKQRGVTLQ